MDQFVGDGKNGRKIAFKKVKYGFEACDSLLFKYACMTARLLCDLCALAGEWMLKGVTLQY